jgi:hypothetical protein
MDTFFMPSTQMAHGTLQTHVFSKSCTWTGSIGWSLSHLHKKKSHTMFAEQGGHKSQPTALPTSCYTESLAVRAFANSCWRYLESFSLSINHLRNIFSIHLGWSACFPHKTQGQLSFSHSGHTKHQVLHHNSNFIYKRWTFCAPVCYFVCSHVC